jgi:hypothetical protein
MLAVASWHLVEKPFLKRKEKHFPKSELPEQSS